MNIFFIKIFICTYSYTNMHVYFRLIMLKLSNTITFLKIYFQTSDKSTDKNNILLYVNSFYIDTSCQLCIISNLFVIKKRQPAYVHSKSYLKLYIYACIDCTSQYIIYNKLYIQFCKIRKCLLIFSNLRFGCIISYLRESTKYLLLFHNN